MMTPFPTSSPNVDNHPRLWREEGLRDLMSEHLRILHRLATAQVGPHVAEDVVSETFSIAWQQLERGSSVDKMDRAWLIGVLMNRCRMQRRAERRWQRRQARGGGFDDYSVFDDDASTIARLDADRVGPHAMRALARLSKPQRTAFILQAIGELSPSEIASVMGLSPTTTRSHLFRAREHLSASLKEQRDEGNHR